MNKTLNSNQIKIIAIIAMTVDHIAWSVFPGYSGDILPILMHTAGRITCPIMCYAPSLMVTSSSVVRIL